ncbi:MAG: hypothetical protein JNL12_14845 [Planctomycetes bacterium]|nr:hypothetical protein [Planctomycetota bacterium]
MNRTATTFASFAAMLATWYGLVGRHHLLEIAAGNADIAAAYERHAAAEREVEHELALHSDAERLLQLREQLQPQLSEASDGTQAMVATSETLATAGLRVDSTQAMPPDTALGRPNARMRLSVVGSFASFFQGLLALENTLPPTRVTELVLVAGSKPGEVRGELLVVRTWSEAP